MYSTLRTDFDKQRASEVTNEIHNKTDSLGTVHTDKHFTLHAAVKPCSHQRNQWHVTVKSIRDTSSDKLH